MSWSAKGGDSLTKGEAEVLGLVDSGLSNREIAAALSIAVGTVKCHLHRAYEKLQARNRIEAAVKARERGHLSSFVPSSAQGANVTLDR
ncbi:MAG: helix-turn-helix transcriptional regulator [Betaproteobacteria bacterium]|nr:MAG: helix-turn-helix transcriptional regulator [Betaproteobacteria bacterium]